MRSQAATQEDFAAGVKPCLPPVTAVAVVGPLTLRVEFADGTIGEVRFMPSHLTGVFGRLADPQFFGEVRVEHGAVTWPGELDIAPDAMYDAIRSGGSWLLQ